jgi:acyl-CoA thioester hydrolase
MVGETTIRVRYVETDQMGVVYHSNFIIWFEVGRVELLRQLGFEYKEMESVDDCHIAVVDLRVRYKAPARYDDQILVRTRLRNVRDSLLHFSYEVARAARRCRRNIKPHSRRRRDIRDSAISN